MTRTHTHPCANCATPVECDGTRIHNYDGWPEVICTAYHLEGGGTAALMCESCLRDEDLRHDADLKENVSDKG